MVGGFGTRSPQKLTMMGRGQKRKLAERRDIICTTDVRALPIPHSVAVVNTRPPKPHTRLTKIRLAFISPSCFFTNSLSYSPASLQYSPLNPNLGSSRVGIEF